MLKNKKLQNVKSAEARKTKEKQERKKNKQERGDTMYPSFKA